METFLPILAIFILLIICCAITMNLHCQNIVTLYRNGPEMVVTFGSFAIALIVSGIVCLFLMMLGIQNVDFLVIAYGGIIISILYIVAAIVLLNLFPAFVVPLSVVSAGVLFLVYVIITLINYRLAKW